MLAHGSRQAGSWLIFDVRQKMKRPRDRSFIHDPLAPAFTAAFGAFFLWASYHTLESQKITPGRILYSVLLCFAGLCSIAPLILQLAVIVKKKRASAAEAAKLMSRH